MKDSKNPTEILNKVYDVFADSDCKVHITAEDGGSIQSQSVEAILLLEIVRLLQREDKP